MTTFTYTSISDFVFEQIYGYQSVNAMHNNMRYLKEDITNLGDNGWLAYFLLQDNAMSPGEVDFYLDGGTTYKIAYDVSGDALIELHANLAFATPPDGALKHTRFSVPFFHGQMQPGSSINYLGAKQNTTNYCGFYSPYDASILAIHVALYATSSHTCTITAQTRVNGSNVLSSSSMAYSAESGLKTGSASQARGVDTISANDEIDVYLNVDSGTAAIYAATALIELCLEP